MRSAAPAGTLVLIVTLTLVALGAGCASRWTSPTGTPVAPAQPTPTYSVPSSSTNPASASEKFNAISQLLLRQSYQGAGGSVTAEVVYNSPEFFQALAVTQATPGKDAAAVFDDYQSQYRLDDNMVFSVSLNTHSVDLNKLKIDKLATLRDDTGRKVSAAGWQEDPGGSGHHRSGALFFPKLDTSRWRYMELVLAGIAGVPERVFRWDLPISYPGGAGG